MDARLQCRMRDRCLVRDSPREDTRGRPVHCEPRSPERISADDDRGLSKRASRIRHNLSLPTVMPFPDVADHRVSRRAKSHRKSLLQSMPQTSAPISAGSGPTARPRASTLAPQSQATIGSARPARPARSARIGTHRHAAIRLRDRFNDARSRRRGPPADRCGAARSTAQAARARRSCRRARPHHRASPPRRHP